MKFMENTKINFMKFKSFGFGLSSILAFGSIILLLLGVNLGIDFKGGTAIGVGFAEEVKNHKGGFVLEEEFSQDRFDALLIEICKNNQLDKLANWTTTQYTIDEKPTAYICKNFACNQPTNDLKTALSLINE